MLGLVLLCGSAIPAEAQTITLQTASGGVTIGGFNPNWTGALGNTNALGIGTPGAGVTVITAGLTGGVLYATPVNVVVSGAGFSNKAVVRAHVSTNYAHPSVLQLRVCYPASGCSNAASYQTISLSSVTPTDVIPPTGVLTGTYTAWFAVFVSAVNGASAFTGADTATVTLRTYDYPNNTLRNTDTLALSNSVQTALRLALASAGGLPVVPASNYSMACGSVNGLGIGPAAGLSVSFPSGGALYRTPYSIQTTFAGFSSTTATVKVYVNVDFAHPAVLELRDSADNTTFAAISKSAATSTTISTTMPSGSPLTRYLGLFVSSLNGAGAFTGADSATLTFTVIVP
jgi:hypothetical protein